MTSTYSTSLRLELMGTGDQSGTWGVTTNTNLGTLLEQAIAGYVSVAHDDSASISLSTVNGGSDEARNMVVQITGTLTAARQVIVPTVEKIYLIKNATSGGFALTVKTSAGSGVSVSAGTLRWVFCDGTNVLSGPTFSLVDDTSPQLGANLDVNGFGITFPGATVTDVTGSDTALVSGTAGTASNFAMWDANGDAVDATVSASTFVTKALFDAQTVLAATSDNTPAALTVAEQTLVGRITSGNVAALTATQVRTLLNVEDGADATDATNVVSALSGATLTGSLTFADQLAIRPYFQDYAEKVNALGDLGGGTDNIDLTQGNVVTATVSTSTQTFTFSNPSASGRACSFTLILTNGGSQTINWPAAVDWSGGAAPSLTASGVDILEFFTVDGGTTWYGLSALDFG